MLLVANLFWGLSFPLIKAIALLHEKLVPGTGGTWFSSVYTVAPRFALAVVLMLLLRPRDIWRATPREWGRVPGTPGDREFRVAGTAWGGTLEPAGRGCP